MSKRSCGWIATVVTGIAIAAAVSYLRGFRLSNEAYINMRWLSDGCFVSGLLMTGFGLLIWVSTTGFFDIFGYGFHSLLVLFTIFRKPENHESFIEYKAKKAAKRGHPVYSVVITGVALILLSVLFLRFYYNA